jgi:hypothetical protein
VAHAGVRGVDHVRILKFVVYSVVVTPLYDHWYQFLDSLPIQKFVSFLCTFFGKVFIFINYSYLASSNKYGQINLSKLV